MNDCKNDVIYFQNQKPKNIKIGNESIFVFKDLLNKENTIKYKISENENINTIFPKYLNRYSREKNKIKSIYHCKYKTIGNVYNQYLILEMRQQIV